MTMGSPTRAGSPAAPASAPGGAPTGTGAGRAGAGRGASDPSGQGLVVALVVAVLVVVVVVGSGGRLGTDSASVRVMPTVVAALSGLAVWLLARAGTLGRLVVVALVLVPALGVAHGVAVGGGLVEGLLLGAMDSLACVLAALVLRGSPHTVWTGLEGVPSLGRLLVASGVGGLVFGGAFAITALLFDSAGADSLVVARHASAAFLTWGAWSALVLSALGAPPPVPGAGPRAGEGLAQVVLVSLAFLVVFSPAQSLALTAVPLPLLAWAALRLGSRATAIELLIAAAYVTITTDAGWGPFGETEAGTAAVDAALLPSVVQGYLVCSLLLSLPPALLLHQRRILAVALEREQHLFGRHFTDSAFGNLLLEEDAQGTARVTRVNDAALAALGRSRSSVLALPLEALVEVDVVARLTFAMQIGEPWRGRARVPGRPGAEVELGVTRVSGPDERPATWSAQLLDVTEEEAARRRAEDAERLTDSTLATTAAMIVVTDPEGRVRLVNDAATRVTGWTTADLAGRHVWETGLLPGAQADLEALATWPNRSGAPVVRERSLATSTGATLRVRWSDNAVRDATGQARMLVLTGIDVTEERASSALVEHLLRAPVGTVLLGLDEQGTIQVANTGAELVLGRAPADLLGTPAIDLVDPAYLVERFGQEGAGDGFRAALASADRRDQDPAGATDWVVVGASGDLLTLSVTVTRVDEPASRSRFLVVARDVTEERRLVQQLRALDSAKTDFVMTVSHELRTPTTSILGYSQFLAEEPLEPEQLQMVQAVLRNARRLAAMNEDLLFLARLDAGVVDSSQSTAVDLGELATALGCTREDEARERGLALRIDAEPGARVQGDAAQLTRMLDNLIGNALKFTDAGGSVTVTVGSVGDEVSLVVEDTGMGIPVDEQDGLFQRFYRSSTAVQRAVQGPGLGLSIVAAVVAAHAGRVSVRSAHLEGATFSVALPQAADEQRPAGRHAAVVPHD
ncbi:PAS domain-containing sensor histidine kinase [Nocardioides bruguierae]|uniref:PAS domain-containing sensor histidine kinase n=1 Tax=Nocardioides bruguierae TaxID=2945102 RepID=UPI002020B657|nr:ATP-binding protein [Nocardioides bruguierae]MCL8024654.1 ATP-binding protein [Nocardioides bruguierae]